MPTRCCPGRTRRVRRWPALMRRLMRKVDGGMAVFTPLVEALDGTLAALDRAEEAVESAEARHGVRSRRARSGREPAVCAACRRAQASRASSTSWRRCWRDTRPSSTRSKAARRRSRGSRPLPPRRARPISRRRASSAPARTKAGQGAEQGRRGRTAGPEARRCEIHRRPAGGRDARRRDRLRQHRLSRADQSGHARRVR